MIRKAYLTLVFLLVVCAGAFAQSGAIRGKILDKANKQPIPFATVIAEMNGTQVSGGQSDFDGEYIIKPLSAGKYTIRLKYTGYKELVINDVVVSIDKTTFQDLMISATTIELGGVEIIEYKAPLFGKDDVQRGATLTREDIQAAPTRDVKSVAAQAASVFQKDEGDDLNVRGSRSDATDYYVDGIRIRGSQKLPQSGIEQVTVVVGGTPAQYGDATGGVISITTRGPSKDFTGGLEVVSSEMFDQYGYNLVSADLSGPLMMKKLENGGERAVLGFFLSGEYQSEKDPDPSGIGMYKLKDNVYQDLIKNPLELYQTSATSFGSYNAAQYYTMDDFEKTKTKNNVKQTGVRFTAKFDYQPSEFTTFTLGGSYNTNDRRSYSINRVAYNFDENPQIIDRDYRVFGRLTQRVASTYKSSKENASVFKNVYFTVQAEYSKNQQINQDPVHKDKLWNYGYIGKFDRTSSTLYVATDDTTREQIGYSSAYGYQAGGINTIAEAYTNAAYSAFNDAVVNVSSLDQIRSAGGVRNGDATNSVMAIWEGVGNLRNTYQNFDNDQYRVTLSGNADIKKHSLLVGFEFEQRVDRGYSVAPRSLWGLGRQYANFNLTETDFSVGDTVYGMNITAGDTTYYTINHPSTYAPTLDENGNVINGFYENLRNELGIATNAYVDFDALSPDQLNIGMFNADQLVANGLVSYYGFDYKGEKMSTNPTFKDYFTQKDGANYTRAIGAFRPTYMAGYIQDRFTIDNLSFNIGLRVDRFDANQKALKDKFLLLDSYTVDDYPVAIEGKPDNIGGSFVPYLASASDPTSVIGYRDGNVWYNKNGQIVSDPDIIASQSSTGTIVPAIKPDAGKLATDSWNIDGVFEDYKPQISVMPRIAFAFNITDEAQFFAHYDVLTQRPSSALRNDPSEYLSLRTNPDGSLNNAGLKPERTTDYELGFKQKISKSSALTISAFYRELKNMIQITKVNFAYPNTYTTYDNIDFGTVKGISMSYDLRRTGNVRMLASYTLQFADGTGSSASSNTELTNTDQPNLRFIIPLDYDTRHQLTASFDYHYKSGEDYDGPIVFGKPIFANAGANIVVRANSGTPYTRQSRPTREAAAIGWQSNGQRTVEGLVNGARTPWQFRMDLKLDKDIEVKFSEKKSGTFNVYLQIQNFLDTRNVVGVYRATGNATDDGFLQSADGLQLSSAQTSQQAFIDQYNIRLLNPDNYSLPRRARLGVRFDF